ncbi:formiminotransferase-cyclodeaminase [Haloactinopolyspora alba]|uniref:Formiminotransferase-cyclodeaminase n=1 Tax=Haloactinopolyspora alba TaxID=648780 RepID=A0A2P8DIB5_9ACTN|nr:cyclodeaminase/cyclohydrolase family protein [Haloactinopolyspora alba]PSK96970.1 formiminotransferase-cyclodeaminase [Haloactinopolyspora alba]
MTPAGWERGDYLDRPLRDLLDDTGGHDALPAAGTVVATTAALASALVVKIARRSRSYRPDADELVARAEKLLATVVPHISGDAALYAAVLHERSAANLRAAMIPPRVVAETSTAVAELAADLADTGNPALAHDAAAAHRLATTAADVAASLTAANDPREDS